MHAVKEWGKLPSDLGLCDPSENLLFMTAHEEAITQMRNFEEYVANENRRKRELADRANNKLKGRIHV